ncbi:MAG: hypothetical protein H6543_05265 [Prevotellaceae bacterium]|nr:hypothetical protein [Prevotellaceae bacterium]
MIFFLLIFTSCGRISTSVDPTLRAKYGVELDQTSRSAFGLSFKGGVNYARIENFKVISTLGLFTLIIKILVILMSIGIWLFLINFLKC